MNTSISFMKNDVRPIALNTGRKSRETLVTGLLSMYRDNEVDQYYDASLVQGYNRRYMLFNGVIISLAVTSILVPLIIRFA